MKLYRVIGLEEFDVVISSEITPRPSSITKKANTWEKPTICLFDNPRDCISWASSRSHKVILELEIEDERLLEGIGIYPNLDTYFDDIYKKEYGVSSYTSKDVKRYAPIEDVANSNHLEWYDWMYNS